jgi:SAM-dependent methyltransferase
MHASRLYESEQLLSVTGSSIRPGGLALTARALTMCPLPTGARVLDIGCGQGATVACLRQDFGLSAMGIDFSALLLGRARHADSVLPLVRGRAEQLPFADRSLAAVFFECSLSLMLEPSVCLNECRRVLTADGLVIVSDVYLRGEDRDDARRFRPAAGVGCLSGAVSRDRMIDRLHDAGFETRGWEDHSVCLKQMAARMVFVYGSLREFWASACGSGPADAVADEVAALRPGYCLMWARKRRAHG